MKIELEMINFFHLPQKIQELQIAKYMEYIKNPKPYVMQSHVIGKSQHLDFRMKINSYLIGWSVVGGNIDNPITPTRLLREIGKGHRAEPKCPNSYCNEWKYNIYEKDGDICYDLKDTEELWEEGFLARQPLLWLKVEGEIKPGKVGAGREATGRFKIVSKGQFLTGCQKVWFHEYFVKDASFPNWTRITIRRIRAKRLIPGKVPGERKEPLWLVMIPKDQRPYAITRGITKGWKPPKGIVPFPEEWTKKKFLKEYQKWKAYMSKRELAESIVNYTLSLHSYRGPVHVRGMFVLDWYLFIDDKEGALRTFHTETDPVRVSPVVMDIVDRSDRKYLTWEGRTRPDTRFNPNKKLAGELSIVGKGKVSYETKVEDGVENIVLIFKTGPIKGKYTLRQEEKDSPSFALVKLSELELSKYPFVLHRHYWDSKEHWDLRWKITDTKKREFNLYANPITTKESIKAVHKTIVESPDKLKLWMVSSGTKIPRSVGKLKTYVDVLDSGTLSIIEDSPNFISIQINGKKLKGYYIVKKDTVWIFKKGEKPGERRLSTTSLVTTGDPRTGNYYKPLKIVEKKGWNYFFVYLYDLRSFTRCEPYSRVKEYLPDLTVPSGATVAVCLYSRVGKIHGGRIAYVKFDKEQWDYSRAEKWIHKQKLYNKDLTQIRKKR